MLPGLAADLAEDLGTLTFDDLAQDQLEAASEDRYPLANLADGIAGVAFALWHYGRVLGERVDPARLVRDALANGDSPLAFQAPNHAVAPDPRGLFYGRAGLEWIASLTGVAAAAPVFERPAERWPELYFGRAGHLCAGLFTPRDPGSRGVTDAAAELCVAPSEQPAYASLARTGQAHGVAGVYFALLLWTREFALEPPPWLRSSIDHLCELGAPWPSFFGGQGSIGGFCNGSPGLVQLFVLAREVLGEDRYAAAAAAAADDVLANPPTLASFCCGAIGESYALLAMSRISADPRWHSAALERAAVGLGNDQDTVGLLSGEAGALCLATDLIADRRTIPFLDPQ